MGTSGMATPGGRPRPPKHCAVLSCGGTTPTQLDGPCPLSLRSGRQARTQRVQGPHAAALPARRPHARGQGLCGQLLLLGCGRAGGVHWLVALFSPTVQSSVPCSPPECHGMARLPAAMPMPVCATPHDAWVTRHAMLEGSHSSHRPDLRRPDPHRVLLPHHGGARGPGGHGGEDR